MFMLGEQIGTYRLQHIIGSGNSATVYLAESLIDQGQVAIKLRARGQSQYEETLAARFIESSRLHLLFCHPNIAWLHEWIEDQQFQASVIEYLSGGTLTDHLIRSQGRLSIDEACLLGVHIADGLEHMHDIQVIHRDIKPDNLLFADAHQISSIRIADFDVSKNPYTSPNLTEKGAHVGTLCYTAPEQFNQEKPRAVADVYSLGMVLFETMSGRLPFETVSAPAIFSRFLDHSPLPKLSVFVSNLPPEIDWIIERSIVIPIESRIPSAATLATLLLASSPEAQRHFKRTDEVLRLARVDWLELHLPTAPPLVRRGLMEGLTGLGLNITL